MYRVQLLLFLWIVAVGVYAPSAPAYPLEGGGAKHGNNAAMEAVGGLGASNLYLTYLSMGSVYDNYIAGVYDSQTSRSLVLSLQELINASVQHLERVREASSLSEQDKAFLTSMIETYGMLQKQSAFFLRYIKTGAAKEQEKFQQERVAAWEKISSILGIE